MVVTASIATEYYHLVVFARWCQYAPPSNTRVPRTRSSLPIPSKQHLDRFSRFCRGPPTNTQTKSQIFVAFRKSGS